MQWPEESHSEKLHDAVLAFKVMSCVYFLLLLANQKLMMSNRRRVYTMINREKHILKLFRVSSRTKMKKKKNKGKKNSRAKKKRIPQIQQLICFDLLDNGKEP